MYSKRGVVTEDYLFTRTAEKHDTTRTKETMWLSLGPGSLHNAVNKKLGLPSTGNVVLVAMDGPMALFHC